METVVVELLTRLRQEILAVASRMMPLTEYFFHLRVQRDPEDSDIMNIYTIRPMDVGLKVSVKGFSNISYSMYYERIEKEMIRQISEEFNNGGNDEFIFEHDDHDDGWKFFRRRSDGVLLLSNDCK